MPAKKRNDKKYKPFIGRLFILRKHKTIIASKNELSTKFSITSKDIGDAVLVLDENNTRVKITVAQGGTIWISKFYLHKEITSEYFSTVDKITEIIYKLLNISEKVNDYDINSNLKTISNELSQILDNIQKKKN